MSTHGRLIRGDQTGMPPQQYAGSPSRPSRFKRESSTITRSVGKALADVMNKDKAASGTTPGDSDAAQATVPAPRRVAATTRERTRGSRPSLDLARGSSASGSDKPTPKLVKRPPTAPSSFPSKPATRHNNSLSATSDDSPSKPSEKASKPRTSLTLRGLSSALQPKSTRPPSALPKYKPKSAPSETQMGSGARKRPNGWDGEKDEQKDDVKGSEEDADDDFVAVKRPISPLPRRAARKPMSPASEPLAPSMSPRRGNVLHKRPSSISSTPPRASKVPKASPASTTPTSRRQNTRPSVSRPSSSASLSQRATPVTSPTRKPVSVSRAGTMSSVHSVRRHPTLTDDPVSGSSKLDSSPGNPFQLPEATGLSLLSPPLSPFLEGVSLDSIETGDVSALLSTVVSPIKPASAPAVIRDLPPQTLSHKQPMPEDSTLPPPQTPILQSSLSPSDTLTTDPRQSMLSLRQLLEGSGDLEHLLSQPLPAVLTPDARERLLSFGFSPTFAPPPFPHVAHRPEPQTPTPVHDGQSFTSISQVLFPQLTGDEQQPPSAKQDDAAPVQLLKMQLASAELQCAKRDTRIEQLEGQLFFAREAREQEATELSNQVSDLEEQLKELLSGREREKESDKLAEDLEARLRDKDAEWERQAAALVARVQEQGVADQERLLGAERRKWSAHSAAEAWECARTTAINELELVRSNKGFVQVILAGLNISMQQLRQSSMR